MIIKKKIITTLNLFGEKSQNKSLKNIIFIALPYYRLVLAVEDGLFLFNITIYRHMRDLTNFI